MEEKEKPEKESLIITEEELEAIIDRAIAKADEKRRKAEEKAAAAKPKFRKLGGVFTVKE
jgi:hypothetical protein